LLINDNNENEENVNNPVNLLQIHSNSGEDEGPLLTNPTENADEQDPAHIMNELEVFEP